MRKRAVEFGRRAVEGGSGSSGGGSELLPEAAEELLQKVSCRERLTQNTSLGTRSKLQCLD